MKMRDALKDAVARRDAVKAGKLADFLRFKNGLNYEDIAQFAHDVTGVSAEDWEDLMGEADRAEGEGRS